MKNIISIFLIILVSITFLGCQSATKIISAKALTENIDIFTEVTDGSMPPEDYADIIIKASIKTHLEGFYLFESKKSLHGKNKFPFLINIDGQPALWFVEGIKENKAIYDKAGKRIKDPEAGEGIKYSLDKKIRMKAGKYKIFFALPEEKYFTEVEITLKERNTHILEFKPFYRHDSRRIKSFMHGIKGFEITIDGHNF